jgi:MFS superfamily sulfate permease-like transporter
MSDPAPVPSRTPIARRRLPRGLLELFAGVSRATWRGEVVAGVTVLAIMIPQQLATSQLARVPAFLAMIAFIVAMLTFLLVGSNPILTVGADSTIAPLFAVALLRLAPAESTSYLELVAATAVVTGLAVAAVGWFRLGWLGDFLSLPIITGFLAGIGVIIIVDQLPHVLGVPPGGESVGARVTALAHHLALTNGWSVVIALGTLALILLGERLNPRLPFALAAILGFSVVAGLLSLSHHGVQELGAVVAGAPVFRLRWLSGRDWGSVVTTSLTLVIVIMSQSAATSRVSADQIGVADDLNRDFLGVGLANVVVGLCGSFPVDASPTGTTVTAIAGGRTKLTGLVAAIGALVLSPFAALAHAIPLAALAGVLLYVAVRLIDVTQLRAIARVDRTEFGVALVSLAGVVVLGVEAGLAIAVGLAILQRTWRSARPHMIELGRRRGTTSWEPLARGDVHRVDHVLAVLFDEDLYFANASVFRRELYDLLGREPATRHLVIDAAAMSDLDYTGLVVLGEVVRDLTQDDITVALARATHRVRARMEHAGGVVVPAPVLYESVDEAVAAVQE